MTNTKKQLMKGCEAIAEAAIQAGCRYFFGYPITPQNDIPEYMAAQMPKVGGTYLQAESEVAAINMVYGAAAQAQGYDIKLKPRYQLEVRRHIVCCWR